MVWSVGGGVVAVLLLSVVATTICTRGSRRRMSEAPGVNKAVHSGCRCRARRNRKHFRIHATHIDISKGIAGRIDCGTRVSLYSRKGVGVLSTCAHVGP